MQSSLSCVCTTTYHTQQSHRCTSALSLMATITAASRRLSYIVYIDIHTCVCNNSASVITILAGRCTGCVALDGCTFNWLVPSTIRTRVRHLLPEGHLGLSTVQCWLIWVDLSLCFLEFDCCYCLAKVLCKTFEYNRKLILGLPENECFEKPSFIWKYL